MREVEAISGVSQDEFIELWSTLHVRTVSEYQCGKCLNSRPEQLAEKRRIRSCYGGGKVPIMVLETPAGARLSYRACIGNFYRDGWIYWLQMYRQYQRGLLPFPGTISDQPAKAIEVFGIIELFEEKTEAEKKAKANSRGRRGIR